MATHEPADFVLCCVVLCCVVLCSVVLCCVVLCCVVLCCVVLCLQWRHAKVVQQLLDHLCTYDILYPKTAGSVIRSNPRVLMQHDTGTYKPTDCPQNTPTLGHTIFLSPPNRVPDECVQGAKQKYFQTAPSPRSQHNTTQHNTTQHNTTQHNTTQHNTTQHNTTQHNKIKNKNTAQNDTRKKPKTKQGMTQHNTTQRNTKGKQHNTTHNTYHIPIGRVNTAPTQAVKSTPPPPHVLC